MWAFSRTLAPKFLVSIQGNFFLFVLIPLNRLKTLSFLCFCGVFFAFSLVFGRRSENVPESRKPNEGNQEERRRDFSAIDQLLSRPSTYRSTSRGGTENSEQGDRIRSDRKKNSRASGLNFEKSSDRKGQNGETARKIPTAIANQDLLNQINNLLKRT